MCALHRLSNNFFIYMPLALRKKRTPGSEASGGRQRQQRSSVVLRYALYLLPQPPSIFPLAEEESAATFGPLIYFIAFSSVNVYFGKLQERGLHIFSALH